MNNESSSLISIIMPAYNAEKFIRESIESVLSQTYQNWELLIVNDASTDNTIKIVQTYLADPRIRVINLNENGGLAHARNAGIEKAAGKYITFLDSDDLWTPDKLARQVEYHKQHPEIPISHTRYIMFNEKGEIKRSLRIRLRPSFTKHGLLYKRLLSENIIGVLTVMIQSSVIKSVGGFDDNLRSAEDYDLWLRLSKKNIPFGYLKKSLAKYRVHINSLSRSISKFKKERKKLLVKHVGNIPDRNRNSRIAWGNYYHHFAFEYKNTGNRTLAYKYFCKSFRINFRSIKGIIDLINIIKLKTLNHKD